MNTEKLPHSIVFVQLGEVLPNYTADALFQARLFNSCPIYLIAEQAALAAVSFDSALAVTIVTVESLPTSASHAAFRKSTKVDRQFRSGFWTYVIERFFYLETLALRFGLENIIHLETDNLLYADLTVIVPLLARCYQGIAVPFVKDDRAIAGIVYFKDHNALARLTLFFANIFLNNPGVQINDMDLLGVLRQSFGPAVIDSLPVVPSDDPGPMQSLVGTQAADPTLYTRHFDSFRAIFDPGPLGQFIDGIDPRNAPGRKIIGFINETAVYWPSRYRYLLAFDEQGRRIPYLCTANHRWPIINLHFHSKNLSAFLSRPRPRPAALRLAGSVLGVIQPHTIPEYEVITGERLQALADISIIDDSTIAFHLSLRNTPNIRLCHLRGPRHHLVVDNAAQIREVQNASVIFVYTHLVESFFEHVVPHLTQHFVLITHNSDIRITESFRRFIEDVRVIHWFSQGVDIRHRKVTALPAGLANAQWPHGNTRALIETARQPRAKIRDAYLNIDVSTNVAHREPILNLLASRSFITQSERRPYREYLEQLAEHRFVISPCGNGLDSHRNWEALHLGVIPIVPIGAWMEDFVDLPILPVSDWGEITPEFLAQKEAQIRSERRFLDKILLSYWRNRIRAEIAQYETSPF
ncbi:conserved hypothetical protein [Gammaproteobacteria bacterium]